jgi:glycosyltransferase involved in cell wall biosynthesis
VAAAAHHDVLLLTRASNAGPIDRELAGRNDLRITPYYLDLPASLRWWKRGSRGARIYYLVWQVLALRVARRVCATTNVDVVHHVTFAAFWLPSLLGFLGRPFLLGPVGGGEIVPDSFRPRWGARAALMERLRRVMLATARRNPVLRAGLRRTALAVATTEATAVALRSAGARRTQVLNPPVILHADDIERLTPVNSEAAASRPFRFLSVGRLLHWKGYDLALSAFAQVHRERPDTEYVIVGDGPHVRHLKALTRTHGLAVPAVQFLGSVARRQAHDELRRCDVLLHPSVHDPGAWICGEAMVAGKPVICQAPGGPATLLGEGARTIVWTTTVDQVVADLAARMLSLIDDGQHYRDQSESARARALEQFTVEARSRWLSDVYRRVAAPDGVQ